jgi:hypothetical protein
MRALIVAGTVDGLITDAHAAILPAELADTLFAKARIAAVDAGRTLFLPAIRAPVAIGQHVQRVVPSASRSSCWRM